MAANDHSVQQGIRVEVWPSHTISTGPREILIASGVLREEWIPATKRNTRANVETILPDGREVRVYRKGKYLEVWIEATAQEKAEREAASLAKKAAAKAKFQAVLWQHWRDLPRVVAVMRERYPHARVVEAQMRQWDDGTVQQAITLEAPIERLRAYGLVTPAMIADNHKFSSTTPLGCGYSISDADNGMAHLTLCTETAPREREHFSVRDAIRELKRFRARARSLQR